MIKIDLRDSVEFVNAEDMISLGLSGFGPHGTMAKDDFEDAFDEALEIVYGKLDDD